MPNKTPQTHTLSIFQTISTRAKARAKARQEQEQERKQGKGHKEEQSYSFFLSLLNYLQIHQRVFVAPLIHINITPDGREFRGGGWLWIRSRKLQPHYKINYHLHYNECTDKNIPEYRFRFFKIASHKGYSQWDANVVSDFSSYAVQSPMVVAASKIEIDIAQPSQIPVQEAQGNKAQNNADGNDHFPIVRPLSPNHNDKVTLTARTLWGRSA